MKRLTAFDAVGASGDSIRLRALCERRWLALLRQPLANVPLTFRLDSGAEVGPVPTDASGIAEVSTRADARRFTVLGPGRSPAEGQLYRFDRDAPLLVCDLDRTVSDGSALRFWLSPNSFIRPFDGAPEALRTLSHHFRIVYLTARRDLVLEKTRRWLELYLFPPGPIVGRPWSFLPPSPEEFKRAALADLTRTFARVRIGIGDRAHDARAYLAHGLTAIAFRPTQRMPEEAVLCTTWNDILRRCLDVR
jgi:hypothetical protein